MRPQNKDDIYSEDAAGPKENGEEQRFEGGECIVLRAIFNFCFAFVLLCCTGCIV